MRYTFADSNRRREPVAAAAVLAVFFGLILWAHLWGDRLTERGERLGLELPPLFGRLEPRFGWRILPAAALAALVIAYGPRLAARLPWRALLLASWAGAAAWAVALAFGDGTDALTQPVLNPLDAFASLDRYGPPREFVETFVARLESYPIHVQAHPPGLPLLLLGLQALGQATPAVVAGLFVAAGASAAPAVLMATKAAGGEAPGRRAAPWLVLAPYAVWVATSADALYAGVAAWAVATAVMAFPDHRALAFEGGVLFGGALLLTYGAAPLGAIPAFTGLVRNRLTPVFWWAIGAVAVLGFAYLYGFWWLDGLAATRERYFDGLGGLRPYRYFLVANLAALAIALGPGALRGLAALRIRFLDGAAVLVAGALAATALAWASGLSKGEVERIWLPFMPWLVIAGLHIDNDRHARWWLASGAATALAVQVLVRTPW